MFLLEHRSTRTRSTRTGTSVPGAGLCLLALAVPAQAQQAGPSPSNVSFGNISVMAGGGASVQRGEQPRHGTLGVGLGVDFLKPWLIATGQLRAKFLDQEDVRDPSFICATQDCGPTHRLGLQADAYVDLTEMGPIGLGISGSLLAFRGTLSTIVVQHPGFEQGLTAVGVGPSVTFRSKEVYGALAPIWTLKHEQTLGDDRFTSTGYGITGVLRYSRGRFGVYGDGRLLLHRRSGMARTESGDVYLPPPHLPATIRTEDAAMADADLRVRYRISDTSYVNVGVFYELSRSALVFFPTGLSLPREFMDRGVSLSFEFLQY